MTKISLGQGLSLGIRFGDRLWLTVGFKLGQDLGLGFRVKLRSGWIYVSCAPLMLNKNPLATKIGNCHNVIAKSHLEEQPDL